MLGCVGAPALAQDDGEAGEIDAISAMLGGTFTAEPLTADEEARVPQAAGLIAKVMPEGWYREMMDDTIMPMLAPLMEMAGSSAMGVGDLVSATGMSFEQASDLSSEDRAEITALLDPFYGDRNRTVMDLMIGEIGGLMGEMEPAMREGMSKAYAKAFSARQLQDIATFFATETGEVYAAKSMLLAADPQVMSASAKMTPMLLERMPVIFEKIETANAELPDERGFADLSADEQGQLASLLGVSVSELEQSMSNADNAAE